MKNEEEKKKMNERNEVEEWKTATIKKEKEEWKKKKQGRRTIRKMNEQKKEWNEK